MNKTLRDLRGIHYEHWMDTKRQRDRDADPGAFEPVKYSKTVKVDAYGPILETYREVINPRGQMTTKAREKIQVRMSQGYTIDQLCQCLVNASSDPWWTKTRNPIAFYYATQERVEQLLALDIAEAATAVQEVRDDEQKLGTGCPKCGSVKFYFAATVWHCDSCGHTQQGTADKHPRSGIDPRDAWEKVELRLGRGPVPIGQLVADASRPERDTPHRAPASGDSSRRQDALPGRESEDGSPGDVYRNPEDG